MKQLEVTEAEFDLLISGLCQEISHLEKLSRRKINNSLKVHIENRLPLIRALLAKLQAKK
jgi:hypothetical protein